MGNGNTETTKKAAEQMVSTTPFQSLKQEIASEGVYHVVVEGGYHTQALSDSEAEYLTELIIENGIEGLMVYVEKD